MYPKMLYLKGWDDVGQHVVVQNPQEEKEARVQGYKDIDEKPERKKVVKDDGDQ